MKAKADIPANLELWSKVCNTPPSYTKKVNQRGGFTAIDATFQAQMATEHLGPHGLAWGFRDSEFDYTLVEQTGLVVHKATFFYVLNGKEGSFPIHNAITIWSDKNKTRADEDFAKKVETNTLNKALSRLGFSADVFLGMFDDTNYVKAATAREEIEKTDKQVAEKDEQRAEFAEWASNEIGAYAQIPNAAALRSALIGHLKKAEARCRVIGASYDKARARFQAAHDARLDELVPKIEVVCKSCGDVSQDRAGALCSCGGQKEACTGQA